MAVVTRTHVYLDGETLTAALLNNEFNNLLNALALMNADVASNAAINESKILFSDTGHGHAGGADGHVVSAQLLKNSTGTVDISASTPPTVGQALVATDSTHATWQNPISVGSVIQTIMGTSTTQTSNATTSFVDTTLTATITPRDANSKILVLFNHGDVRFDTTGLTAQFSLLRNGSIIYTPNSFLGQLTISGNGSRISESGQYLDTPSLSSAITYKTQFKASSGSGTVYVQQDGTTGTMILMEIAG